jgi:hypothetical protein
VVEPRSGASGRCRDIDADSWRNKESQTFHKNAAHGKDGDNTKKSKT